MLIERIAFLISRISLGLTLSSEILVLATLEYYAGFPAISPQMEMLFLFALAALAADATTCSVEGEAARSMRPRRCSLGQ